MRRWSLDGLPLFVSMEPASRLFSPYDLNPLGINPLRDILERSVDFEASACLSNMFQAVVLGSF